MRKIFNVLLALILVFNLPVAEAEEATSDYYATYTKLESLGLLSNEVDYSDEKSAVKRVDFVITALKFINKDLNPAVSEDIFADVDKDYYAAGYIKTAVELGLLNGYADGNFMPQNPIAMNQAVKVIVRLLGYSEAAETGGGYPNGYLSVAYEKQLLKGISNSGGSTITYADMLKLLENSMETDVMGLHIAGDNVSVGEKSDVNILSLYHDIYYDEGVVTANDVTSLLKYTEVKKGNVNISGTLYDTADSDIASKLGYAVDFYYRETEDDSMGEILYFEESRKNQIVTVNYEDIAQTTTSFSFEYYNERDRKRTEKITADTNVLVNGKLKPFYDEKDLKPAYGEVILIDNNNDGDFEVIDVFSVTDTIVVNRISQKDDVVSITDKLSPQKMIKLDNDLGYSILKDGVKILFTDLAEFDVLLVGRADDGYMEIYASDKSINGKVNSIAENKVVIDDEEYVISENYLEMSDAITSVPKIKLGMSSTFYLDYFGSVASVSEGQNDAIHYGFLFKIYTDDEIENKIRLKILTDGNENKTFDTVEKIKFDGKRKEGNDVKSALESPNAPDEGRKQGSIRQLIRYALTEDGLIDSIETVGATEELRYEGSLVSSNYYDYYVGTWNRKFWEDANTKTFCIYDDESECQVVSKFSTVLTEQTSNYTAYFYNKDDSLAVDAVIRYFEGASTGTVNDVDANNPIIIAEKIVNGLDSDDNSVKIIEGYDASGKKHSVYAGDSTNKYAKQVLDSIVPGDVFVYSTSNTGALNAISKIFDSTKQKQYGSIGLSVLRDGKQVNGTIEYRTVNSQRAVIYAKVNYVDNGNVVYSVEPGDERMIQLQNVSVSIVDIAKTGKVKITTGLSAADILPGSDILVSARYNKVNGAVVIKSE